MKISRGDSSQSIERSSSELLMKFDRSKLERPWDGAGSGFPQPPCLLQMRRCVKCLKLWSALNNYWGFWTLIHTINIASGHQYDSDKRDSLELKFLSPKGRLCRRKHVGWQNPQWSQWDTGGSVGWQEQRWPCCFSLCVLQRWRGTRRQGFLSDSAFGQLSIKFPKPSAASHAATWGLPSLSWSGQRESSLAGCTCNKLKEKLAGSKEG